MIRPYDLYKEHMGAKTQRYVLFKLCFLVLSQHLPTHKPEMSIFDRNAKPLSNLSRGHWGYNRQTSGHSPPL